MTYRTHFVGAPLGGPNFGIVVDDDTLTWTSDPPGNDIPKAITAYFTRGGPVGSGKQFEVLPGGRARRIK